MTTPNLPGEFTDRGFYRYAPIIDNDGSIVKVFDSSCAALVRGTVDVITTIDGPFLWVDVARSPEGPGGFAHLTVEQVERLRDQLDDWLRRMQEEG